MHPTQEPDLRVIGLAASVLTEPDLTPADILRCAALYIERHGWTQGAYYDVPAAGDSNFTPPACAHGAIAIACYGKVIDSPSYYEGRQERLNFALATAVLGDYIYTSGIHSCVSDDHDCDHSVQWNDAKGLTGAEVIRALRAAADDYDRHYGNAHHNADGGTR